MHGRAYLHLKKVRELIRYRYIIFPPRLKTIYRELGRNYVFNGMRPIYL